MPSMLPDHSEAAEIAEVDDVGETESDPTADPHEDADVSDPDNQPLDIARVAPVLAEDDIMRPVVVSGSETASEGAMAWAAAPAVSESGKIAPDAPGGYLEASTPVLPNGAGSRPAVPSEAADRSGAPAAAQADDTSRLPSIGSSEQTRANPDRNGDDTRQWLSELSARSPGAGTASVSRADRAESGNAARVAGQEPVAVAASAAAHQPARTHSEQAISTSAITGSEPNAVSLRAPRVPGEEIATRSTPPPAGPATGREQTALGSGVVAVAVASIDPGKARERVENPSADMRAAGRDRAPAAATSIKRGGVAPYAHLAPKAAIAKPADTVSIKDMAVTGIAEVSQVGGEGTAFQSHRLETAAPASIGITADGTSGRFEMGRHAVAQMAEVAARKPHRPVEIALNPEELGRVRMSLSTHDAGVTVQISAERPETMDLLRRHIDQLAADFRKLGYEQIGFEFTGHSAGGFTRHASPVTSAGADATNPAPAELPAPTQRPATSGLDLRL